MIDYFKKTTLTQKVFIQMIDNNCRHAFVNSLSRWNNYKTPLMLSGGSDEVILTAEHKAFSKQWQVLERVWGLNTKKPGG